MDIAQQIFAVHSLVANGVEVRHGSLPSLSCIYNKSTVIVLQLIYM